MTIAKIKGLLQQISFIEADMDIQKQILMSIPSKDTKQMETVISGISDLKKQVEALRLEIKNTDEAEHKRIIAFEEAAAVFRNLAADKQFVYVNTLNESGTCFVDLNDDTRVDCLVTAREENGNWTVLTLTGQTRQFPKALVKQGI